MSILAASVTQQMVHYEQTLFMFTELLNLLPFERNAKITKKVYFRSFGLYV